jgi:2-oxoglutarate ferredoxin oxidoreductase subunit beta
VNLKIILFNNQIYGLTKGQFSPTSLFGQKTKSTPLGVIDYPVNPIMIALASEASFIARSVDSDPAHLSKMVDRLARHEGSGFLEVYQNCNIFNDGAFDAFKERDVRDDRMIEMRHGEPLVFGKQRDRGIRLNGLRPEVVEIGDGKTHSAEDLLVHDEQWPDSTLAAMLARMHYPEMPVPIGVFRAVERPIYEAMLMDQIAASRARSGPGDLMKLLYSGDTWVVE